MRAEFLLFLLVPVLYADLRRRSTFGFAKCCMSVYDGVEVGVVIHLQLTVEFEAAAASNDGSEEVVEAGGEIAGLFFEDGEAGCVAEAMGLGGSVAMSLDAGVEHLEGEDGETVDDESGGLGVEWGGGLLVGKVGDEPLVELFDEVVAALVEAVDGVLDTSDLGVGGEGVASLVLFVPEIEVLAVLGGDESGKGVRLGGGGRVGFGEEVRLVPVDGEVFLQASYGGGFEHGFEVQIHGVLRCSSIETVSGVGVGSINEVMNEVRQVLV
jgi:hypothetical protein